MEKREELASATLSGVCRELAASPRDDTPALLFEKRSACYAVLPGRRQIAAGIAPGPVLPLELRKDDMRSSAFTPITPFYRVPDVKLQELRIEKSFPMTNRPEIIGRQSSHFTRLVRIFALELGLDCRFTPIMELMDRDPATFAGNPALKLPILKDGGETVFGSSNICRWLWRRASGATRVFWPEDATSPLLMNAHEILAHAMTAQVEVIVHEIVEKRPGDNASAKRRESLVNCLKWLDGHLGDVLDAMPRRDLSLFEPALFCLASHVPFRNPLDLSEMASLCDFERRFGQRESALATPYRFDQA